MFAMDRDLLALEPMLLQVAAWTAQTLHKGTASIMDGQATFAGADLYSAGVQEGMLALVGGTAMEVISIDGQDTVSVSLTRDSPGMPVRWPLPLAAGSGMIVTYRPQIALVHGQLLRMLGLDAGTTDTATGRLAEDRVTNPSELALVEALGTLHLICSAAAALVGTDSPMGQKAAMYKARFAEERWRAEARIDLDGDGRSDAARRLNVTMLNRG